MPVLMSATGKYQGHVESVAHAKECAKTVSHVKDDPNILFLTDKEWDATKESPERREEKRVIHGKPLSSL